MSMDTAACIPYLERIPEQRCTCRLFEIELGSAKKDAIGVRGWCAWLWVREDEHVRRRDPLFLDARWGDVDFVPGGVYVRSAQCHVACVDTLYEYRFPHLYR